MSFAIGDTISFIATFRNPDGSAATGLTVTALSKDAYTKAGASITFPTLSSFAEIGSTGRYRATAVPVTAGTYTVIAHATGSYLFPDYECGPWEVVTAAADPAALATAVAAVQATVDGIDGNVDVAVSTRATPGSYITTGSAVATNGKATIYKGDDQVAVASRSLDWSTETADKWPDLTGATIRLSGQYRANAANTVSATGSVITPTGATKHVRFEFSRAATEALKDGVYEIQVIATLSGGQVITLVDTTMTVKPRKGP